VLLTPFLAGLAVLVAWPVLRAAWLSLEDWSTLSPARWVGLENYRALFGQGRFWDALRGSAIFVAIVVPLKVGAALLFGLLLSTRGATSLMARVAVFAPSVVPASAYALVWVWLLNPLGGPVPALISAVGVDPPVLLTDGWVRGSIAVAAAAQFGEAFLVVLAVRAALGPRLYEVAAVEGASPWTTLRRVTLPLIAPALVLLCARETVVAASAAFAPSTLIGARASRADIDTLPLLLYDTGFRYLRLGDAAAVGMITLALTALAVAVQLSLLRRVAPWVDLSRR
jgi:multiple sugar transport system permease protein